jgi:hypothetical protein
MKFCGEISYAQESGGVHSDICWGHAGSVPVNEDFRALLHACLDEWLTKSNGTGAFWVGDPGYFDSSDKN